jgi:hypothetical protein
MVDSVSIKEYERYMPDIDFTQIATSLAGYAYARISIFDHWLSEQEAAKNKVMFYSLAEEEGLLSEYLSGERKFLILYLSLSTLGVVCKYPSPLRRLEYGEPELENVIVNSLREKRLMDVYFIAAQARIVGGHDRTDLLILKNEADLAAIHVKVKEVGLFLLT